MHSGDNKEAFPYTAIKSNDIMDFLGNSNINAKTVLHVIFDLANLYLRRS